MAESLPYGIVPHGFYWPLLGQKSSHQKSYRTEILATIARAIVTRAVDLRDSLTLLWRPNIWPTNHHLHGIYDDLKAVILNN
jgi:hypothetical protein